MRKGKKKVRQPSRTTQTSALARGVAVAKIAQKAEKIAAALKAAHRGVTDMQALARKVAAAKTSRKRQRITAALQQSQRRGSR